MRFRRIAWFAAFTVLFSAPPALTAQTTEERLRAPSAKDFILLSFEKGALRYVLDDVNERRSKPVRGTVDVAVEGNSIDVRLPFRSPFLYKITVEDSVVFDPVADALTRFATAAGSMVAGLPGTEVAGPETASDRGEADVDLLVVSPSLLTWSLYTQVDSRVRPCLGADRGNPLIESLNEADRRLFQRETSGDHGEFLGLLRGVAGEMAASHATPQRLGASLDSIKTLLEKAAEADAEAEEALEAVEERLGAVPAEGGCANVRQITRSAIRSFLEAGKTRLAQRKKAVTEMEALRAAVFAIAAELVTDGERRIATLAPPADSVITMRVELTPYEVELADDGMTLERTAGEPMEIRIRAFRKRRVLAEFAPGVAYTTVEYPQFGTREVEGQTLIASADPEEEQALPLAMLNLILDYGDLGVQPLVQLGLSTAKNRPVFAGGGGVRVRALGVAAAFTVGAVWTWKPELVGAEIGAPVSGTAELQDAIGHRFESKPGLYIALAINP